MARVEYVVHRDAQRVERCRLDASQPVRAVVAELVRTCNVPTADTSGHPMVDALYTEENRRVSAEGVARAGQGGGGSDAETGRPATSVAQGCGVMER